MAPNARLASYLFTSGLVDAIFPVFYIFLPLFAVQLGASPLELGLVGGAAYAVYSFMPFVMGHFSDRRGSRMFFTTSSLVLLAVVSFLYSASTSTVTVIVVRVLEGIGWAMLWPALEAAITEDSPRDTMSSLAVFNYVWSGGAALGPFLGTFLIATTSYRFAFFISGILFVIPAVLNGVVLLRYKGSSGSRPEAVGHPSLTAATRRLLYSEDPRRNFEVRSSIITLTLSTLALAVFFTFFGPYAASLGVSIVMIGAVTTVFGGVRFLTYAALGNRSLRHKVLGGQGRMGRLVVFTSLASLSSLLLLVRDPTTTVYFIAFGLFGVGYSLVYVVSQTVMIAETDILQRGAGAGLFESSLGLGGTIGPITAGILSGGSLTTTFGVPAAGLVLVLAILYVLSITGKRPRAEQAASEPRRRSANSKIRFEGR